MVLRLAMEVPEKFAAVAAVVASNPVDNKCRERHLPVSVLFMNGTADPILPYKGEKSVTASTGAVLHYQHQNQLYIG